MASKRKSRRKTGGRKKGTPNKVTQEVREALIEAFNLIGDVPALVRWGKRHPSMFYALWSKLLPQQHKHAVGGDPDGQPIRIIRVLLPTDTPAINERGVFPLLNGKQIDNGDSDTH